VDGFGVRLWGPASGPRRGPVGGGQGADRGRTGGGPGTVGSGRGTVGGPAGRPGRPGPSSMFARPGCLVPNPAVSGNLGCGLGYGGGYE